MVEAAIIALKNFNEISEKLNQPDVTTDAKKYTSLMKEYKRLEPIALKAKEANNLEDEIDESNKIIETEKDHELVDMASMQLEEAKENLEKVNEELKILLLPKDPNDEKTAIVEIRAGTGGEEAALFAGALYRMYCMFSEKHGLNVEVINSNETELGGYKEISFELTGPNAFGLIKFESGTHRVQRVPDTESQGRIQTSAATVAVLPEVEDVEVNIDPKDLKIDTYRSSGAGGQHINKTESAIRITHLPTGLVVECQDERSQFKNREKAMRVLKSRLQQKYEEEQNSKISGDRKSQVGSGDRSERIRTYNFPQGRVTDHRVNKTIYKIDTFMDGDMDEILDALKEDEQARKLKEANLG